MGCAVQCYRYGCCRARVALIRLRIQMHTCLGCTHLIPPQEGITLVVPNKGGYRLKADIGMAPIAAASRMLTHITIDSLAVKLSFHFVRHSQALGNTTR